MKSVLPFVLVCWLVSSVQTLAQTPASYPIQGRIVNTKNEAVAYKGMVLKNVKDSVVYKGTLSDSTGKFRFERVAVGSYWLCIGSSYLQKLDVNQPITLPVITLPDVQLQEVVVTARKPFLEFKADRLIANIGTSALARGNNALEVLRLVPSVQVTLDGSVSVMGKPGAAILIDGKPAHTFGTDVLRGLRSEHIDRVEVYSNPPAKFDASGSSVINIITKKNLMDSYLSQSWDTPFYPTTQENGLSYLSSYSSLTLFLGSRKLRTRTSLGWNHSQSFHQAQTDILYKTTSLTRIDTTTRTRNQRSWNAGIGADYLFNKRTILTFDVSAAQGLPNQHLGTTQQHARFIDPEGMPDSTLAFIHQSKTPYFRLGWYGSLSHTFDSLGKRVVLTLYRTDKTQDHAHHFTNTYTSVDNRRQEEIRTMPTGNHTIQAAKIDFELPTSRKYTWELGTKLTHVRHHNTFRLFRLAATQEQEDQTQRNDFLYKESIWAAYVSVEKELSKYWSFSAGLRNEYTTSVGTSDGLAVQATYNNLFPSVFLRYKPTDEHQIGFSYTRRIQRPTYSEFNPRQLYANPLATTQGSSNLTPQFMNAVEANYNWKDLYMAVSVSRTKQRRIEYLTAAPDGTLNMQFLNLSYVSYVTGILSKPYTLAPWWQTNQTVSVFYVGAKLLDGSMAAGTTWSLNSQQTFTVTKKSKIEASFFYVSRNVQQYDIDGSYQSLDIGYQTSVLKNKLDITLRAGDILGIGRSRYVRDTPTARQSLTNPSNNRTLVLSLMYRFPTTRKFQKKQKQEDDFGEIR